MQVLKTNESKPITIYDIAKEAEVSPATVSRVLTGNTNVRKEKRKKVLEIIEKYNFKPNAMARGLSETKSKIIGILVADVRNPFYAELFLACEQAAKLAGYTVMLCNSLNVMEQEEYLLDQMVQQRVDAIIQIGGRVDDLVSNMEYVEKVNQVMNTTPVVVTGKLEGTKCKMVRIDSMKAMELLMEYLISLGHREIAMVGGSVRVLSTYEKLVQYRRSLQKYHIPYDPDLISAEGSYNVESGYRLMNEMLAKSKRPTAVVAINDFAATGVMHSLLEHGFRIPEDVSVVGYDNTYISQVMNPSITTIDYNYQLMGECLIEAAIDAIEDRGELLKLVTPSLVIRKSSGAKKMSKI